MDKYREQREVFSQKVRAGKRTYIFDVRATRANDYYITITERKRQFDGEGFQKQKIFLYKEDFNKFLHSLGEVIGHVKEELMPEYDFEQYDRPPVMLTGDNAEQDWHLDENATDSDKQ